MNRNKKSSKKKTAKPASIGDPLRQYLFALYNYFWKSRGLFIKSIVVLVSIFLLFVLASFLSAQWYTQKHKNEPLKYGTTFIPSYARYFGLDPQQTMDAMLYDLGLKRFRLVSYWSQIEATQGIYDFSELDWQIKKAEEAGAEVNLSVGLRQPRWPECHMPTWAESQPYDQWYPELKKFMTATVERYKDSPAVVSYQVENEFFLTVFGDCPDFTRERLVEEVALVRSLDPGKKIIVTRSNNWGGVPVQAPTPDEFGVAVYKRVWDETLTKRYFEYPYPPWFYGSLAGFGEMISGKPLYIHELQMEPWIPPDKGFAINDLDSIPEQNKSMDAKRLAERFDYGRDTGMRTIDTWGAEWWYWRKEKAGDPSLWETAKKKIGEADRENTKFIDGLY